MKRLHMLKSATDTIVTSFIYEENGVLLVIDGGFESEADTLLAYLKKLGGHVNGWFLTHAHNDHYGALGAILREHAAEVTIDAIYSHFPPLDEILYLGPAEANDNARQIPELFAGIQALGIPHITPRRGDVYAFGSASLHVLREYDPAIRAGINNTSMVYRLDAGMRRVMFLGDLGELGGRQLLAQCDPDALRADYCQMAHHGQAGVERSVYEAIRPTACLWPTPTWVWDNLGPNGYDSGGLKTVIVRGWMSEIGVRRHYIDRDAPHVIDLEI